MATKNLTSRKRTTQRFTDTSRRLTVPELQRLSEKLAIALNYDSDSIALLTLLFDHLEQLRNEPVLISSSIGTINDRLFVGTPEASEAQKQFSEEAFKNRGKLLLWPKERKGAA